MNGLKAAHQMELNQRLTERVMHNSASKVTELYSKLDAHEVCSIGAMNNKTIFVIVYFLVGFYYILFYTVITRQHCKTVIFLYVLLCISIFR